MAISKCDRCRGDIGLPELGSKRQLPHSTKVVWALRDTAVEFAVTRSWLRRYWKRRLRASSGHSFHCANKQWHCILRRPWRSALQLGTLHPVGHMGEISDVVDAILCLESAGFVTGENPSRRWRSERRSLSKPSVPTCVRH